MRVLFTLFCLSLSLSADAATRSCTDAFKEATLKRKMVSSIETETAKTHSVLEDGLSRIEKSILTPQQRRIVSGALLKISKLKPGVDYTQNGSRLAGSKIQGLIEELRQLPCFTSANSFVEEYLAFAVTLNGFENAKFKDSRHALLYSIARAEKNLPVSNWILRGAELLAHSDKTIRETNALEDFGLTSKEKLALKTKRVIKKTLSNLNWIPMIFNNLKNARTDYLNTNLDAHSTPESLEAIVDRVQQMTTAYAPVFRLELPRWRLEEAISKNYMARDDEILLHFASSIGRLTVSRPEIRDLRSIVDLNRRLEAIEDGQSSESLRQQLLELNL